MYCARIFKEGEEKELNTLLSYLYNNDIKFDTSKMRNNHKIMTPPRQVYKTIIHWKDDV